MRRRLATLQLPRGLGGGLQRTLDASHGDLVARQDIDLGSRADRQDDDDLERIRVYRIVK